jgi:hypothetical protein
MTGKLTKEEVDNLKQLISSKDQENWKLAEEILMQYECDEKNDLLNQIWVNVLIAMFIKDRE